MSLTEHSLLAPPPHIILDDEETEGEGGGGEDVVAEPQWWCCGVVGGCRGVCVLEVVWHVVGLCVLTMLTAGYGTEYVVGWTLAPVLMVNVLCVGSVWRGLSTQDYCLFVPYIVAKLLQLVVAVPVLILLTYVTATQHTLMDAALLSLVWGYVIVSVPCWVAVVRTMRFLWTRMLAERERTALTGAGSRYRSSAAFSSAYNASRIELYSQT